MLHWYNAYAVVKIAELLDVATNHESGEYFVLAITNLLTAPGCKYIKGSSRLADLNFRFSNSIAVIRLIHKEQSIFIDTIYDQYVIVEFRWFSTQTDEAPTLEHPDFSHIKQLLTQLKPVKLLFHINIGYLYRCTDSMLDELRHTCRITPVWNVYERLSTQYAWGHCNPPYIWNLPNASLEPYYQLNSLKLDVPKLPIDMGLDTISFDSQDPVHFTLFNTQHLLQALDTFCVQGYISPDQLNTTKTHLEDLKHFPKYCYVEGLGGTTVIPLTIEGVYIEVVIDFSAQVFLPYLPYLSHLIVAVYCTDFDLPQNQAALNILYNTAQLEFGFLQPYNQSPFTWTNDDPRLLFVDLGLHTIKNFADESIDISDFIKNVVVEYRHIDSEIKEADIYQWYTLGAKEILNKDRHPLDAEFFWREDGDPHPPFWSYTKSQYIVLGAKLAKHLNLGNGVYWPTASEAPHIHQQLAQVTVEDIFEVLPPYDM